LRPAHAAVVWVALVHGSGPQTRDGPFGGYLRAIAEHFAAAGVVVLTYDKRGCGESSGEWETTSFEDLAADACAAVDVLRGVDGVERVGLWGSSQAGWILPIAAAERELATVIVVSGAGCGITPGEQGLYWRECVLRERSVAEDGSGSQPNRSRRSRGESGFHPPDDRDLTRELLADLGRHGGIDTDDRHRVLPQA
jgi:hypothetical protein